MKNTLLILFLNLLSISILGQLVIQEDQLIQHLDSLQYTKELSVSEFTEVITEPYDTQEEKVIAASYWIAKHIRYDDEGLRNGYWHKQTFDSTLATKVLQAGKAICGGYTMLAKLMFDELNIENQIVRGIAKGRNYNESSLNENHVWNIVRIDSIWQIFDVTWASPKTESSKVNLYYFNPKPTEIISTHLPSNDELSLLDRNYTITEFLNLPRASDKLFKYGIANSLPIINYKDSLITFELNKNFEGEVGFILHEVGTYNSDIIEYISIDKENLMEIQIPIPSGKVYEIEMTYISMRPMRKHFEILTFQSKRPTDSK